MYRNNMRKNGPTNQEIQNHERFTKILNMLQLQEMEDSSIIDANQSNEIEMMANGNGKNKPKPKDPKKVANKPKAKPKKK